MSIGINRNRQLSGFGLHKIEYERPGRHQVRDGGEYLEKLNEPEFVLRMVDKA